VKALERAGPYEIIAEIARGGMGIVFKARDKQLKRYVAIKVLRDSSGDPDEERRFRREAEAAARLQHSNIVPIHTVGEVQGRPFFVMDFIDGRVLTDIVRSGELSPRAALDIAEQTAEALHYAHSQGVIHRDLKPANVIIDRLGRPQVMDFGLAKQIDDDQSLTKTGTTMGTPAYMPPEQAEGDLAAIDEQSDVYSLGALLYEMLTGVPPFQGSSTMNILMKVLEEDPIPPRRINPRIHRDIETICLKAMAKEKRLRYRTAHEFAEDIRRFRAGEAISAAPASVLYRLRRSLARTWPLVTATGALVFFSAGVTGYVLLANWRERVEARLREDAQVRELLARVERALARSRELRAAAADGWRRDSRKLLAEAEDDARRILWLRPGHPEASTRLDEIRASIGELRVAEFLELAQGFLDAEQYAAAERLYRLVLEDLAPGNPQALRGLRLVHGVGRIWVRTVPAGVEVTLRPWDGGKDSAGLSLGKTPVEGAEVEIGRYRLVLSSALVGRHEIPLEVRRSEEVRLENLRLPEMGGAGSEMVLVPAGEVSLPGGRVLRIESFAIDRYESGASLGTIPRSGMGWVEAAAACREAGKRLCSFHEWRRACAGDARLAFPYGNSFDPSRCWTGALPGPAPAGGRERCASPWGVYDMSGNLAEWVGPTRDEATTYGGDWSLTEGALLGCYSDHRPPLELAPRSGFRCCKGVGASVLVGEARGVTPSLAGVGPPPAEPVRACPADMVQVPAGEFQFDDGLGERQPRRVEAFCIDRYEFPNRAGALPEAAVSWVEAARACREKGRRLCTAVEWQRACRGPAGYDFPYGSRFDPAACRVLAPLEGPVASGSRPLCKSGFHAYDMSGNLAEWVGEADRPRGLAGGSFAQGRFESRCAYLEERPPDYRSAETGFRCCATLSK